MGLGCLHHLFVESFWEIGHFFGRPRTPDFFGDGEQRRGLEEGFTGVDSRSKFGCLAKYRPAVFLCSNPCHLFDEWYDTPSLLALRLGSHKIVLAAQEDVERHPVCQCNLAPQLAGAAFKHCSAPLTFSDPSLTFHSPRDFSSGKGRDLRRRRP